MVHVERRNGERDGVPQFVSARRLSYSCCARAWARRGPHVGFQARSRGYRLFCRRQPSLEFPGESWLWRSVGSPRAPVAASIRGMPARWRETSQRSRQGDIHDAPREDICLVAARRVARLPRSHVSSRRGRFAITDWGATKTGAPRLEGALIAFECVIASAVDVGTPAVLICEVVGIHERARTQRVALFWPVLSRIAYT